MRIYSKEGYRSLLKLALEEGYKFIGFLDKCDNYSHCIYLRHDIDYSLNMALELAEINASMGVQGTFSVLLRSQVYNLLSHWALSQVKKIHALGQHLAFHYALPPTIPTSDGEFAALILADFDIVQRHLPEIEPAFAWHNTTPELISRGLHLVVPGLVNIYSAYFIKDIPYYSDTYMRYSVAEFEKIIARENCSALHLLFHPLHWVAGGRDAFEALVRTWPYIIHEREHEMRNNREWARHVGDGMPSEILDNLVRDLLMSLKTNRQ
ncbi:hypothetical protein KAX17_15610 [Candidatus Bipolaricaulota bacterium]|nr:hypothetical protein [Candidatus Bipolaricaulota bacterium]